MECTRNTTPNAAKTALSENETFETRILIQFENCSSTISSKNVLIKLRWLPASRTVATRAWARKVAEVFGVDSTTPPPFPGFVNVDKEKMEARLARGGSTGASSSFTPTSIISGVEGNSDERLLPSGSSGKLECMLMLRI